MNGFERRTQQKREAILRAARDLFTARGITDVSVADIAEAAGVSPVTIFKYFGDKMTLARETFIGYVEDALAQFEEVFASDRPFLEKMRLAFQQKQRGLLVPGRPFLDTIAWGDPILQGLVREIVTHRSIPLFMKLIDSGKAEGMIDATIPNEAIVDYIIMFVDFSEQHDIFKKGDAYLMGLVKLSYYGLIGRPPNETTRE